MPKNEVRVTITGDAEKFKKSLSESESALGKFSGKMKAVGSSMRSAGSNLAMGVTLPLVGVGVAAVKMAGELQDSQAMAQQVFGKSSSSLDQWASGAAKSFGLAKGEAIEAANQMGIRLRNIGGMGEAAAAQTSQRLTALAGDMASAFGGPVSDASEAITAALTGEFEQLKKYGIVMNDAALKNEYFKQTGEKVSGTLTAAQKQQAALGLITEQTSLIQGDFARNADGATNSQKILQASLKDVATTIGTNLLPIVTRGAQFVAGLAEKFGNLSPTMQKVITIVGVVAAALGPVIYIGGVLATVIGAIASPVGLVVAALVGLGVALVALYKKNEGFRKWVQSVVAAVRDKLGQAFTFVKEKVLPAISQAFQHFAAVAIPALKRAFDWLVKNVVPVVRDMVSLIGAYIRTMVTIFQNTIRIVLPIWRGLFAAVSAVVRAVWPPISAMISAAMQFIRGIIRTVTAAIRGDWSGAWNGIKMVLSAVWSNIKAVVSAAMAVLRLVVSAGVNAVGGIFRGLGRIVVSAVSGLGNAIAAPFRAAFDIAKSVVSAGLGVIRGLFNGLRSAISGALSGLASVVSAPFRAVGGAIRSAWNSTIGGRGITIPDIPGLPGRGRRFEIPRLHTGGMVPGIKGSDVPAILQAGEYVMSVKQVDGMRAAGVRAATGGTVVNVTVQTGVGDPVAIGRTIVDMVKSYENRNGTAWRSAS